jgi:hypothetical protein
MLGVIVLCCDVEIQAASMFSARLLAYSRLIPQKSRANPSSAPRCGVLTNSEPSTSFHEYCAKKAQEKRAVRRRRAQGASAQELKIHLCESLERTVIQAILSYSGSLGAVFLL